jgi:hypothetical protein
LLLESGRVHVFGDVDHGDVGEQRALLKESTELLSIFTAIGKSTKARNPITAGFAEIRLNICSEVWCVETFRRSTVVRPPSSVCPPLSPVIVGIGFHPELTGRENIYLNGAILGMKKAEMERKFDEIVAFAEVERPLPRVDLHRHLPPLHA